MNYFIALSCLCITVNIFALDLPRMGSPRCRSMPELRAIHQFPTIDEENETELASSRSEDFSLLDAADMPELPTPIIKREVSIFKLDLEIYPKYGAHEKRVVHPLAGTEIISEKIYYACVAQLMREAIHDTMNHCDFSPEARKERFEPLLAYCHEHPHLFSCCLDLIKNPAEAEYYIQKFKSLCKGYITPAAPVLREMGLIKQ